MNTTETHHFQAEIEQLLDIVIHSLYTDKEIFVRELISNAADALEKLRFHQASGQAIHQPELPLGIKIETDEAAGTLTITDTGVGMSHGELVENLGTIAHSGSKAFLKQLAEDKKADAKLIGQFGVGFYSAFMAARKVEVFTQSYRSEEPGCHWVSEGPGGYTIETAPDLPRGARMVLHLKEDAKEFAKADTLKRIVERYSNFISFPIEMNGSVLNTIQAIWARSKSEIKEEEYTQFYHYIGHDQKDPLYRLHFTADAPLSIQALLFVPPTNFESLGLSRTDLEVHLYCRKVLIQSKAKGLLPEWLRFLKGVVDSEDLPLNISRETMQDTSLMQKLNKVLTGRFLKFLEEQAEKDAERYQTFYEQYARFLKEGVVTDFVHAEPLGRLLRYESSALPKGQKTSLAEYVKRMPSDQKEIFYLMGPHREAIESSPYYEAFKARQLEVLFFYDPWDEFVMEHLHQFDSKPLRAAEKAEVQVDRPAPSSSAKPLSEEETKSLAQWMKEVLGDRIGEVRASKRLVDSPALVLDKDKFLTSTMRRMLKTARQEGKSAGSEPDYDLEINPNHSIMVRLDQMRQADKALAAKVAEQVLDNARVAAGLLEDPRTMLSRLNELMERVLTPSTPAQGREEEKS